MEVEKTKEDLEQDLMELQAQLDNEKVRVKALEELTQQERIRKRRDAEINGLEQELAAKNVYIAQLEELLREQEGDPE